MWDIGYDGDAVSAGADNCNIPPEGPCTECGCSICPYIGEPLMDPLTAGLITGGSSLLGSIFSSDTSAKNTQMQIAASQQQQASQNAFSERMSSTAYQRASQDMQSAGLNPMMMFGSGSAASSPQGSGIQAPMPQNKSSMAELGSHAQQVVTTAINAKTFDKMTEEIANLQKQQALTAASTDVRKQEFETEKQETLRRGNMAGLTGLQFPAARFSAKEAEAKHRLPEWLVDAAVKSGYVGGKVSEVLAPIGQAVSSARGIRGLRPRRSTTETSRSGDDSFTERFHY